MVEAPSRLKLTNFGVQRSCGTSPSRGGRQSGPCRNQSAHSQIAWSAAARLRNRIVHGYWDIDVETLVATAIDDLPQMIAQLEDALSTLLAAEDHDPNA